MSSTITAPHLFLDMEEMESLDAPTWAEFFGGVSIGLGVVGLVAAGIAIT